jgi:hypothetical protein
VAEAGEDHKALRRIASALIEKAASGDVAAIKEIGDRLDGKPAQAIGGDDELGPIKNVLEVSWKSEDSASS